LKITFIAIAIFALFAVSTASQLEAQENPLACSVCQLVIQFVESQATSNATVDKINGLLTKVCNALRVTDWCNKNLLPLIPQILAKITEKENPQVVCQQIKLCAPQVARMRLSVKPEANPLACGLCQGIVNVVEQQVQNNWTVTQIDNAVMRVCNRLKVGAWCQQNVIPRVQEVLSLLLSKASPDKVCAKLKLCDPTNPPVANVAEDLSEDPAFDLKCALCESVISAARQTAGNDNTQAGISRAIQGACGKIPFAKDICNTILGPLVQKIAQDLINGIDTHKVCTNIKMCK